MNNLRVRLIEALQNTTELPPSPMLEQMWEDDIKLNTKAPPWYQALWTLADEVFPEKETITELNQHQANMAAALRGLAGTLYEQETNVPGLYVEVREDWELVGSLAGIPPDSAPH